LDAAAPVAKPKKPKKMSEVHQDLFDIVRFAHLRGVANMTNNEIRDIYQKQPGKNGGARGYVGEGTISSRVYEMLKAGWLLRSTKRKCLIAKGRDHINTVRVPGELSQDSVMPAPVRPIARGGD
jgi:hypothetical protein